jgi:uncharacterized membrane protein YhaH (DUF805 family)
MGGVLRIILTPSGRLNRTEYAVAFFGGIAVFAIWAFVLVVVFHSHYFSENFTDALLIIFGGVIVLWKYISVVAFIKRLHDMGVSGWWWLTLFVPLFGMLAYLVVLVIGVTSADNRYGSPPRFFERRQRRAAVMQPA